MIDAETIPQSVLQQASQTSAPIVMPGDLLDITVTDLLIKSTSCNNWQQAPLQTTITTTKTNQYIILSTMMDT